MHELVHVGQLGANGMKFVCMWGWDANSMKSYVKYVIYYKCAEDACRTHLYILYSLTIYIMYNYILFSALYSILISPML